MPEPAQMRTPIIKLDKRVPLWRRFVRMPIRKSLVFSWNLLMMVQIFLPLNITSRLCGWVNGLRLPIWSRSTIYRAYSWVYGCDLTEMLDPNLKAYGNLSEFFRRSLKPECRPIDTSSLISPVDGKVISLGSVHAGQLQSVKGISYTLKGFLGPITWAADTESFARFTEKHYRPVRTADRNRADDTGNAGFIDGLKHDICTKLFHCIVYLAPGDYHKFHSPADWTLTFRRHFPGKLFSVNPLFTSWIKNLFCLNERAVYIGSWRYGFFSFTAVGANNVGSIRVGCDPHLQTNKPTSRLLRGVIRGWHSIARRSAATTRTNAAQLQQRYYDKQFVSKDANAVSRGITVARGDLFGEFNFGSTVVLIFEAPADFRFSVDVNSVVKFGQALGRVATVPDQ